MNEKTTSSIISEAIARQLSFPRRTTDAFIKAFAETIIEGLQSDGLVKVRGLGTFKLVEVEARESVSVSNGERITIPSFKKLSFLPEDSVGERLTERLGTAPAVPTPEALPEEDATIEDDNEEDNNEPTTEMEENPKIEEKATIEEEPVAVETPADEFSGIDVLISTPESLDDLHQQLTEAQELVEQKQTLVSEAEEHVSAAKEMVLQVRQQLLLAENGVASAESHVATAQNAVEKAREEVARIEQLIDNVESNRKTVLATPEPIVEAEAPTPSETVENQPVTPEEKPVEPEAKEPENTNDQKQPRSSWGIIAIVLLALAVIATALYFAFRKPVVPQAEVQPKQEQATPKPTKTQPQTSKPAAMPKTPAKDSVKVKKTHEPAVVPPPSKPDQPKQAKEQPKQPKQQAAKPKRPATYVIQQGESLTRIAKRFYGSKDSVRTIIRANKIKNPDNVPAGATIKLP